MRHRSPSFLDLVESKHTDATIFAKVYNLLLLPETLYHYAIKDTIDYVPQLAITVFTKDEKFEALLGRLSGIRRKCRNPQRKCLLAAGASLNSIRIIIWGPLGN